MIKVIVFDMDDTLYPEEQYVKSGFKAVDIFLENKGIIGFYPVAIELFDSGRRGKIFNDTLDILEIKYKEKDILNLIEIYRNHPPQINLFSDAELLIEELYKKYPLGLITDGYLDAQKNKVEALNLEKYFEKIVLTDELGRDNWKPSIFPYEIIKRYFNVEHNELVYIGDNATKDFITANKLGWTTIHVVRDSGEYKHRQVEPAYRAQFEVQSLLKVINILNIGSVQSE